MGYQEQPVAVASPPAPVPKERKWLPTLAVFLVIVVVTMGWIPFVAGTSSAIPNPDPSLPPPDAPIAPVGLGVSLVPLPGWIQGERFEDPDGVRLTKGTGNLDAYALAWTANAEELLDDYLSKALEPQASQLQTSARSAGTVAGLRGVRVAYVGVFGEQAVAVEGEVTTVVTADGRGIVFDGWAPQGALGAVLEELRAMITGVRVG